ncbi:MAG TPA: hypothetical protein VFA27_17055 [Vicinamibacterales bacterium]|nr:hypothetical protein [Vicinamibacterales bacterium]
MKQQRFDVRWIVLASLVLAFVAGRYVAAQAKPAASAPSATPIETVWKTRTALAGKTVTVRGKVVKFNGGILGVNWIHVQDGTGKEAERTNDITITSDADAKIGETITATGIVGINKDLGSGYNYPVIIEKAKITR